MDMVNQFNKQVYNLSTRNHLRFVAYEGKDSKETLKNKNNEE